MESQIQYNEVYKESSSSNSEEEKNKNQEQIEKKCTKLLELIHNNVKIIRKLQKKIVSI
jgi:hypothetical protein